ncbi:MAG TPA: MFS transporter, partial [Stellaceae bacterium]|nr:MFS transporter [Stellaceae bacterium]
MNRIGNISSGEKKVVGVAFAGWALDAMDFMSYALIIPILLGALSMTRGEAGIITSAALMTSAVGGWFGGMLADRFGRVRVLQWVVMWFAGFSVLCGFAQTSNQLLILRSLQGFGFGGEWAVGAALVTEMVRPEHRGRVMGFVQSGWSIGWGIAVALVSVISILAPPHVAWHIVMWAGFLPALLVLYVRRYLPESPAFIAAVKEARARPSPLAIFSGDLKRNTFLACLMTVGLQGGYFAVQTWLPTYLLVERHFTRGHAGIDMAIVIIGSFTGNVSHGYLSDRIGRRTAFIGYALGAAVTILTYMAVPFDRTGLTMMALPIGFFTSGVYGSVGAILAELFPTLLRATGQGFTYNFGRGFGAVFPAMVGFLGATMSLGMAIAVFAASAYTLAAAAVFFMPRLGAVD